MKRIKYLLAGALLMSMSAPVIAQSEDQVAIKQATEIIKSTKNDVEKGKQKESSCACWNRKGILRTEEY